MARPRRPDAAEALAAADADGQRRAGGCRRHCRAGTIGAIRKTLGQAHDALAGVVPSLDAAKWGLLAVTLIGIGVMLWARIDNRRKGLR